MLFTGESVQLAEVVLSFTCTGAYVIVAFQAKELDNSWAANPTTCTGTASGDSTSQAVSFVFVRSF
jgi:hypothetical protein